MKPGRKAGLQFTNVYVGRSYFFTHVFVVLSHFISVSFLQSALVFGAAAASTFGAGGVAGASFVAGGADVAGASAANAGAVTANSRPAIIADLTILADIFFSWISGRPIDARMAKRCGPFWAALWRSGGLHFTLL